MWNVQYVARLDTAGVESGSVEQNYYVHFHGDTTPTK